MDDTRPPAEPSGAIEGADAASLGTTPQPEPPSPAVQVDADEELVPGATFGERIPDEPKPWFTSLSAESDQAGVANDDPRMQEDPYVRRADEVEDEDAP